MKKKGNRLKIVILVLLMATTTIVFDVAKNLVSADETIKLEVQTHDDDTDISPDIAELKWSDAGYQSTDYVIKRGVNQSETSQFSQIFALPSSKIQVLNVYPDAPPATVDDKQVYAKDLLNSWMEENYEDTNKNGKQDEGEELFGKNLIEVTTISLDDFNTQYSDCLSKGNETCKTNESAEVERPDDYKFDMIFFGTWDSNNGEDISALAASAVETFIKSGHSVIFGHDTIANASGSSLTHPNFVTLAKYANISAEYKPSWTNNASKQVEIVKNGVFTTYPWNIGKAGDILTIPNAHNLGQTANGDIWLKFNNNILTGGENYYLTTGQCTTQECKDANGGKLPAPCAMIQTGHSSGQATFDEQKIIANLIFYMWYQSQINSNTGMTDTTFIDIDAPEVPTLSSEIITSIDGVNSKATVNLKTVDIGTHYRWEIEAYDNSIASEEEREASKKISNIIEKERITGLAKYIYYIDDVKDTALCTGKNDVSGCIDSDKYTTVAIEKTSDPDNFANIKIEDITIGDKKQTYLHIRAIDEAGNISEQADILVYEDLAPQITNITKDPTIWINKGNVTINIEAADEDGTISKIEYYDEADSSKTRKEVKDNKVKIAKNGTYTFAATDNAGKESTLVTIEVTNIDTEDPIIKVNSITSEADIGGVATANASVTLKDDISGIQKVVLKCGANVRTIEEDATENDGIHYGDKNKTINITMTDAEFEAANNGVCSLEVTDYAGNTSSSELKLNSKITIVHRDHFHHETILDTKEETGIVGQAYNTNPSTFTDYRYVEEAKPSNQNGKFTIAPQTIYYDYIRQYTVNIRKVDISDKTHEIASSTSPLQVDEGLQFVYDAPVINGYKAIGYYLDDNSEEIVYSTTVNEEISSDTQITFVYDKLSTVTVLYEDLATGKKIGSKEVVYNNEEENQTYRFEAEYINNYLLAGYKIDDEEYQAITNKTYVEITMGSKPVTIIFYYKEHSEGLAVKYVDKITNGILKQKEYTGLDEYVGDKIALEEMDIEGYELVQKTLDGVEIPLDTTEIELVESKHEVILYYKKKITLNIVGKDAITKETLYTTYQEGLEGDKYTVSALSEFENSNLYRLQSEKTQTGIYDRNNVTIIFYYNHISAGVKVQHIDKDTGTILSEKTITGVENQTYTTNQETYEKYDFVELEGNATGKMTIEEITVKYYYTKKTGKVVVIYEDSEGNIISQDNQSYTGKVDEKYNIILNKIYGYNIKEVIDGTLSGTYTVDEQILRILVERMKSKITLRYLDEDGDVLDTYESENFVGETLEMPIPVIEGYYSENADSIKAKYEEDAKTIDIYYQKIKNVDNPETLDRGITLYLILGSISLMGLISIIIKKRLNTK